MELFLEGTIIHIKKESFPDKAIPGQTVDFLKYTIATKQGEAVTLNAKKDYSQFKQKQALITLSTREIPGQNGAYKLNIRDVQSTRFEDIEEKEIS